MPKRAISTTKVSTTSTNFYPEINEPRVDSAIDIFDDEPTGSVSPIPPEHESGGSVRAPVPLPQGDPSDLTCCITPHPETQSVRKSPSPQIPSHSNPESTAENEHIPLFGLYRNEAGFDDDNFESEHGYNAAASLQLNKRQFRSDNNDDDHDDAQGPVKRRKLPATEAPVPLQNQPTAFSSNGLLDTRSAFETQDHNTKDNTIFDSLLFQDSPVTLSQSPDMLRLPPEQGPGLASVEAISSAVQEIRSNAGTLNHCATCSPSADKVLELAAQALRLADKVVSALTTTQDKLFSNRSAAAILREPLGINSTMFQSANSKEGDQRGRDIPLSRRDRSSRSRTFTLRPAVSVRAASTKDDDEPELDDGNSSKTSRLSNDDSNSGSDKGIESDSDDDDDDDDRGLDNRKPRGRGWSGLEEQRLRAYRKLGKDWPWIASKIGRTEGAVKQHWGIMETRAKAARDITRVTAVSGVKEKRRAKASD